MKRLSGRNCVQDKEICRPTRRAPTGEMEAGLALPASNATPPDPALVALNRFGLGARPGDEPSKIAADPRGYLKAELKQQDIALISPDDPRNAGLLDSTAAIQASMTAAAERKAARGQKAAPAMQPTRSE